MPDTPTRLPGLGLDDRRAELFGRLRHLMDQGKLKAMPEAGPLPDDLVIVSVRAADFDPAENAIWLDPQNHGAPRDLHCRACGEQVVMSQATFEMYSTRGGAPSMIECLKCICLRVGRPSGHA